MMMMAQPGLQPCCWQGTLATGTPTGTEGTMGQVNVYVARPSVPNGKAVVVCSDVFGWRFPNTRLITDTLAKEGYLAVLPDMFNDKGLDFSVMEDFVTLALGERGKGGFWRALGYPFRAVWRRLHLYGNLIPYVVGHLPPTKKTPLIEAVISELRSKHMVTSVGVLGYCYGATPALQLASTAAVDAFAIAHARIEVPDELDVLKRPGLVICADHDDTMGPPLRKQIQDLLAKRLDLPFKVKYYPGTYHGFAIRGDDKDPWVEAAKLDAMKEVMEWFRAYLH